MWRWQEKMIRVAVYTDAGTSKDLTAVLKALAKFPELAVETLKVKDIQAGRLSEFALVVFPGGSGGGEGRALGEEGRERVRQFVREGKGYIGICAGAYLASCDYPWSLNVLNAKVLDKQHWARGNGTVEIRLSDEGKALLKRPEQPQVSISYRQGPLLAPAGKPGLPPYKELARYVGEVALKGAPKGVMPGTTAIAAAEFGKGRMVCFSPHPEKTPGLEDFLRHAVTWIHESR